MSAPKFIAIGHLSFDVNIIDDGSPSSHIPGGASAYAALTSQKHGISTGVISSVGDDYPADLILNGIDFRKVSSEHTASFANYYDNDLRTQVLLASGSRITRSAIPEDWRCPDVFFAAPLLHEVPTACLNWFQAKLSCLLPSGWLRRWGHDGFISHANSLPAFGSRKWDVIVVSETEIGNLPEQQLFNLGSVVCITRGEKGSSIWSDGSWIDVPSIKAEPLDFTGAGDVWATAFAIAFSEGSTIRDAGLYAAAAASISIESIGLAGCPSRQDILMRMP